MFRTNSVKYAKVVFTEWSSVTWFWLTINKVFCRIFLTSLWFYLTSNAMVYTEPAWYLTCQWYWSRDGYQRISKILDAPYSTINKWRSQSAHVTLAGTRRLSEIFKRTSKKPTREAGERPAATLKELQEHFASCDYSLQVATISVFFAFGLWG